MNLMSIWALALALRLMPCTSTAGMIVYVQGEEGKIALEMKNDATIADLHETIAHIADWRNGTLTLHGEALSTLDAQLSDAGISAESVLHFEAPNVHIKVTSYQIWEELEPYSSHLKVENRNVSEVLHIQAGTFQQFKLKINTVVREWLQGKQLGWDGRFLYLTNRTGTVFSLRDLRAGAENIPFVRFQATHREWKKAFQGFVSWAENESDNFAIVTFEI